MGITAYEDLFAICRNIEQENFAVSHYANEDLHKAVTAAIRYRENVESFFKLYNLFIQFV